MIQRQPFFLLFIALLLALPGCDGGGGSDAGVDGGGLEMSELFGACEADSQCPGEGAVCRVAEDGYPGGFCTIPCEDRTPCDSRGVYHHCATREGETQAFCERRCLNGIDCGRYAYTCAGELPPSGGVCIGVCSSDEDCGGTSICDPYTATCSDAATTTGAITGEPCADNEACRSGQCVVEVSATAVPSGWVGGYCVSNCILPLGYNNSDFFMGDALPNGGCPGDAVCLPADFAKTAEGDLGRCYAQCTGDVDCRDGYTCLQDIDLASGAVSTYSNGLCVPGNCTMDGCPTGYTCTMVTGTDGSTRSVCAR